MLCRLDLSEYLHEVPRRNSKTAVTMKQINSLFRLPIFVWGVLCSVLAVAQSSAELVLVEDGVSQVPIVILEDAPPLTRFAADELAVYLEKVTGAKPNVIEGRPDPLPDHAMWVGYQPVLKDLFPEIDFDFEHPEEILIAANQNHLVIAGRDRWDPDNMVRELDRGRSIEGVQREYGTANAIYTFIQDFLDVRWLWPGPFGEDVVHRETLAFEPFEFRYHPQIRARQGLFTRNGLHRHGFRPAYDGQNWVRHQRLLLDSLQAPGGHAYNDWHERFHETHPEYLALQPDGTRGTYPSSHNVKICHSNPDVWEIWLQDVEEQIARDPSQVVFNASPNDGWSAGHCICENCLAWDHPDGELLLYTWEGLSQDYVATSDRHVTFANKVGRLLKERYPDEDYYVLMLAYGTWRPVPVEAVPDDNVIISSVNNFHNRNVSPETRQRFADWAQVAPNLVWRPNLGFGIWQIGLPRVAMDKAIEDLQFVAENNAIGIFFDMIWDHWATHGPHYYMLAQMTWNPGADGEAILRDYYERGFGKAADEIEAYWNLMQESTEEIEFGGVSWADRYDEAFFEEAYGHLDRAAEAVDGEPEIYTDRIGFVRAGLDYTKAIREVHDLMTRYHASDRTDTAAEAQARTIWLERIRPIARSDKYPYALNEIFAGPQAGRAMRELYPDDLLGDWRNAD